MWFPGILKKQKQIPTKHFDWNLLLNPQTEPFSLHYTQQQAEECEHRQLLMLNNFGAVLGQQLQSNWT